jgi:sigma-B regulation protein RsbU (phosphoserine phosphatase)
MQATDTTAYPWQSDVVYAAELTSTGVVLRVNRALRTGAGDPLEGERFEILLNTAQQPAFRELLTQVGADWSHAVFGLLDRHGEITDDRQLWMRRTSADTIEVIAEPAWDEHSRLVGQVLMLNDDLIATRRSVARRQRDLQAARERAAIAAERVGQLEAILLAGMTPRNFDEALRSLLGTAQRLLPGNRADLMLLDDLGRLELRASAGPAAPGTKASDSPGVRARTQLAQPVLERIATTSESVVIADLMPDAAQHGSQPGSLIGVPLRVDDQVIGALSVRAAGSNSFSEQDLRLLELVGERVALAIGQARLREREQHLAETLQQSLLPESLPEVPGLTVAAHYHPHTASVGGDFYDAIALDGGRLGLAIGDVTGKGLRAAAAMGRLRSGLYAYALEGAPAAEVLTRLGRLAEADGALATAQYLIIEPERGEVEIASAGHPAPLLLKGGIATYLDIPEARSAALGLSDATRSSGRFQLAIGDTLLLYTDGLVERTRDIDGGMRDLATAAERLAEGGPEALCEELLAALAPLAGYRDDVAILAVSRQP